MSESDELPLGLYIHWPFCAAKCPYCDFNSHVSKSIDQSAWEAAYIAEINRFGAEFPSRTLTSIFFGGGTPSLMDPKLVESILNSASKAFHIPSETEITLEANPTSIEAKNFAGYKSAGVNRVSIGVQALNDTDLRALGRLHSVEEALLAIDLARSTFDRVSFDLIYSRQHQTLRDWQSELTRALDLGPDHLSLYQLTIEDGTAFGDRYRAGKLPGLPDDDLGADMYFLTQDLCNAAGLPAYEVSNHARDGSESRHNLIYWTGGDYIGIGPGAHGRLSVKGNRFATETELSPNLWLTNALRGQAERERTLLSDWDIAQERILMGLRLRDGIPMECIDQRFLSHEGITQMIDLGFLENDSSVLRVTGSGRPVLNGIIRAICADLVA